MGWRGLRDPSRPAVSGVLMVVLLVAWQHTSAVKGEGLRDFQDGWLMSIRERARVLEHPETRLLLPGGQTAVQPGKPRLGWWLGVGQGQLYSMEELVLGSVEGGLLLRSGKLPISFVFSWERLGEGLYLEDTRTVGLGVGDKVRVGVRVRARQWLVENELVDSGLEVGLQGAFSFKWGKLVSGEVGFWLHAAGSPGWHAHGGRRTLADFKLFYPGTGLALRVDQKNDGAPVLSLEILGRLSRRLGLGWRIDPETGTMGGNFSIRLGGFWLFTSHLVHPALGVTHRFQIGTGDPGAASW